MDLFNKHVQKIRICLQCDQKKQEMNQIKRENKQILTMNRNDYTDLRPSSNANKSLRLAEETTALMKSANHMTNEIGEEEIPDPETEM